MLHKAWAELRIEKDNYSEVGTCLNSYGQESQLKNGGREMMRVSENYRVLTTGYYQVLSSLMTTILLSITKLQRRYLQYVSMNVKIPSVYFPADIFHPS